VSLVKASILANRAFFSLKSDGGLCVAYEHIAEGVLVLDGLTVPSGHINAIQTFARVVERAIVQGLAKFYPPDIGIRGVAALWADYELGAIVVSEDQLPSGFPQFRRGGVFDIHRKSIQ
jgi:hypothetical protein